VSDLCDSDFLLSGFLGSDNYLLLDLYCLLFNLFHFLFGLLLFDNSDSLHRCAKLLFGRFLSGQDDCFSSSFGLLQFDCDEGLGLLSLGSDQLRLSLFIFAGLFLEGFVLASIGSLSLTLLLVEDVLSFSLLFLELLLGLALDLANSFGVFKSFAFATDSDFLLEGFFRFTQSAFGLSLELLFNFLLFSFGLLLNFFNLLLHGLLGFLGLFLDLADSLLGSSFGT